MGHWPGTLFLHGSQSEAQSELHLEASVLLNLPVFVVPVQRVFLLPWRWVVLCPLSYVQVGGMCQSNGHMNARTLRHIVTRRLMLFTSPVSGLVIAARLIGAFVKQNRL